MLYEIKWRPHCSPLHVPVKLNLRHIFSRVFFFFKKNSNLWCNLETKGNWKQSDTKWVWFSYLSLPKIHWRKIMQICVWVAFFYKLKAVRCSIMCTVMNPNWWVFIKYSHVEVTNRWAGWRRCVVFLLQLQSFSVPEWLCEDAHREAGQDD